MRQKDFKTQPTQGRIGELAEQLDASDRGVIKFRKIVMEAIATSDRRGTPNMVLPKDALRT